MNKTVYISGSITDHATGQPRDGWQKDFLEAEAKLRAMGFYVINPVDIARKVVDAFRWRFRYYGGPMNSTGEPLQNDCNFYAAWLKHKVLGEGKQ